VVTRTLADLVEINRQVVAAFDEREQRPWGIEATLIELAKQVGDLARAVLTVERYYLPDRQTDPRYAADRNRIGNELADILYCVMRVADVYEVDLAEAHLAARAAEWAYLFPGDAPPWAQT
jgi:NTP pyrophosphatase (non-canonical NTP hydrolase)